MASGTPGITPPSSSPLFVWLSVHVPFNLQGPTMSGQISQRRPASGFSKVMVFQLPVAPERPLTGQRRFRGATLLSAACWDVGGRWCADEPPASAGASGGPGLPRACAHAAAASWFRVQFCQSLRQGQIHKTWRDFRGENRGHFYSSDPFPHLRPLLD